MADKVQKIREEVERLMNELIQEKGKGYGSDADDACILELQNILTYIDSLQEEPVSKFDSCIQPGDDIRYNEELGCRVNLSQLQRVAKKDPKYCIYSKDSYTDEERKSLCDGCEENCKYNLKQKPDELTHSVTKISDQEMPISDDLEKEIDRWSKEQCYNDSEKRAFAVVARHFANWQKQKMMKGVVEGRLSSTITGSEQIVSAYAGYGELGNDGDKVKLIIIKED